MGEKKGLSARAHAYLFGVIAKRVVDAYGEQGIDAIARGVVAYGRQRGQRMAERTLADGFEPSGLNYVAYGERLAEPGDMAVAIPAKNPDVQFVIKKCPWYDVWQEHGLLANYGYLYCKYVDIALAQGYNPALQFDVLTARAFGDDICDMRIQNVHATEKDEAALAQRIQQLGRKAKMPWDYHCTHLYKTVGEAVVSGLGPAGRELMQKALQDFGVVYGQDACDAILMLMDIDYNRIPPYIGING